jgi:hypothetical protein
MSHSRIRFPVSRTRGANFWIAVGLALVAGIVAFVELHGMLDQPASKASIAMGLAFVFWNCVPMLGALGLVLASRP